jgi:acetyl-CoA carboxylase biotin carboxylase subunit
VKKILVANRGEIAVRVIKACRELGIPVVAVYSEADRKGLHVLMADEAVCIGPSSPLESYLKMDAILDAAKKTGCDAVHPGYGFLAENDRFAELLEKNGITFIGPPASVIRSMGSKLEARAVMRKAGVPIVPGTLEGSDDADAVLKSAGKIDGPLFIKASAGGGGKGMRLVEGRDNLAAMVREAIGEAKSAFGDGTVYIEKAVQQPRHIEIQVLADNHGNVVHLFERECSIQRRHQKVLEETPSVALDDSIRSQMGEAAVKAAQAVGYRNAGTVEFMLDGDKNFYFLEMNTRIQVEHPITEMTTGIDLVRWQIRIARGEKLGFDQAAVIKHGHAIECRIYAEDADNNFLPSCGVIQRLREPWGPGIRNDSGIYEGWEVSPFYDPILSKLVAWGEDRDAARQKMLLALDNYIVHGIKTSVGIHKAILRHPAFIEGATCTDFFEKHREELFAKEERDIPDEAFIAAALHEMLGSPGRQAGWTVTQTSPWKEVGRWEIGTGSGS